MAEYLCEECETWKPEGELRDISSPAWNAVDPDRAWMCCRPCEERMKAEEPERYRKLTAPTEAEVLDATIH